MKRMIFAGLALAMAARSAAAQTPPPFPALRFGSVAITAEYGLTATGSTQGGAKVLSKLFQLHQFATVPLGAGAVLPSCEAPASGQATAVVTTVYNDGANQLSIYPTLGQAIGQLGATNPMLIDPKGRQTFTCKSSGQWDAGGFLVGEGAIRTYGCAGSTCIRLDPNVKLANPVGGIGTYAKFTPTLAFVTSNDATIAAPASGGIVNDAVSLQMDRLICVRVKLAGKLNYSTGSGTLRLTGLPAAADDATTVNGKLFVSDMTGFSYPPNFMGNPYFSIVLNNTYAQLTIMRSTGAAQAFTSANIASGTDFTLVFDGCYIGKSV